MVVTPKLVILVLAMVLAFVAASGVATSRWSLGWASLGLFELTFLLS